MVLRFEPTTFSLQVSSKNQQTRASAPKFFSIVPNSRLCWPRRSTRCRKPIFYLLIFCPIFKIESREPTTYYLSTLTLTYYQCDQLVRLLFQIWPFAAMKINTIMSQICQSRHSILPNKKKTVKIVNFCQSGKISPNLVTLLPIIP